MTKEQYEAFENSRFLADEEMDKLKELNVKNGYGLSRSHMKKLCREHKSARFAEDYKAMALIEYRLTDINFHSFCGLLNQGEYKKALEYIPLVFEARNQQ